MNNVPTNSSRRGLIILTVIATLVALGYAAFASTIRLSLGRDAAALRNGFAAAAVGSCDKQLELGIGPLPLFLARCATQFFDVDPAVRAAVESLRGAEVGIYEFDAQPGAGSGPALLASADAAMSKRGWERVVAVAKEDTVVLAYVPGGAKASAQLRICVLTLSGSRLVVVSAKAKLQPLEEIVTTLISTHGRSISNVEI